MGNVTIGSETRRLNDTLAFETKISSFDDQVKFSYIIEALPLDYLTRNNSIITAQPCLNPNSTSLNCLNATDTIKFEKCTNRYSFNLSYNYDLDYSSNVTIIKPTYSPTVNILCKNS